MKLKSRSSPRKAAANQEKHVVLGGFYIHSDSVCVSQLGNLRWVDNSETISTFLPQHWEPATPKEGIFSCIQS